MGADDVKRSRGVVVQDVARAGINGRGDPLRVPLAKRQRGLADVRQSDAGCHVLLSVGPQHVGEHRIIGGARYQNAPVSALACQEAQGIQVEIGMLRRRGKHVEDAKVLPRAVVAGAVPPRP